MPELRSLDSCKADQLKVEMDGPDNTSSPGRDGGTNPGPSNKLAGETWTMKRTSPKLAQKGSGTTRRME